MLSRCMCVCMPFTASICIGKKRGRTGGKKGASCCALCNMCASILYSFSGSSYQQERGAVRCGCEVIG